MNLEFDGIPASIRKPGKYFELNTALAVRTLPANEQHLLIIGQRLAAGTVAAQVPIRVFSDVEAGGYFGYGSQANLMVSAAIKANPYADITVCAVDDAEAGIAATGTVEITAATAPASGALVLHVGNQRVEAAVSRGDAAATVAGALGAAVNAMPALPVTATVAEATVTLTARNKGTCGNAVTLVAEAVNGATTATVTPMDGGATDPDLSGALAACFGGHYHVIVSPLGDQTALTKLSEHLESISGPLEQRPGVGIYARTGALADATTLAGQINSGRMLSAYVRGTRSLPFEVAAAMAALVAGEEDPARPLNTLQVRGIHVPAVDRRLSRAEQESCLHNGVTPLEVGPGERLQIVRAVSTYTSNAQGNPDVSLLDITTIRTLDYVRKACRERLALRFPRAKLNARTAPRVRTELLDVLLKLEELEIVEAVQDNAEGLIVERDAKDPNRLNARIPADVVNGLHIIAGRIDLLL